MSDLNLPLPPSPPTGFVLPMSFGQILDRVFRLMRSHLWPFAAIGVAPMAVLLLFYSAFFGVLAYQGVFQHPPAQPNPAVLLWTVAPMMLLFIPIVLLAYGLYYGAATHAALQAGHGLPVTVGASFRAAWSKLGRYTWLMILRGLIVALPILACVLVFGAGALVLGVTTNVKESTGALFLLIPLFILAYLGGLVYAILMSLRLSLAFPACVNENLTAMQAIKRSGVLTNGAKGRIFLVLLIVYAIGYALVMVLYAVVAFIVAIGAVAGAGHFLSAAPWSYVGLGVLILAGSAVLLLWTALLMAAYSTAFAVLYRDQCVRKDAPPRAMIPTPAQ